MPWEISFSRDMCPFFYGCCMTDFLTRAAWNETQSGPLRKGFDAKAVANDETRTVDFTISTGSVDRENDTINPKGWNLKQYRKNPVVLWAHDYHDLPIARASSVSTTGESLISSAQFVPGEIHPFAETVYQMLKLKFLRAVSVGFNPTEFDVNEERRGIDFTKQDLLEYSVVPVPANAEALTLGIKSMRAQGVDVEPLKAWAERVLDEWEDETIPREMVEAMAKADASVRVPVSDDITVSAELWTAITERVDALEEQTAALAMAHEVVEEPHVELADGLTLELADDEPVFETADVQAAIRDNVTRTLGETIRKQVKAALVAVTGRVD